MRHDLLFIIAITIYLGIKESLPDIIMLGVVATCVIQGIIFLTFIFKVLLFGFSNESDVNTELDEYKQKIINHFKTINSKPFLNTVIGYVLNISLFALILKAGFILPALFHAFVFMFDLILVQSHGKLTQQE